MDVEAEFDQQLLAGFGRKLGAEAIQADTRGPQLPLLVVLPDVPRRFDCVGTIAVQVLPGDLDDRLDVIIGKFALQYGRFSQLDGVYAQRESGCEPGKGELPEHDLKM